MKIQYGMERWGTSIEGEPSWVTISVSNGQAEIVDVLLQPEGLSYTAPFSKEDRLLSLHLYPGVSDSEGEIFVYPLTNGKTELLSVSIRDHVWIVNGDAHASLAFLVDEKTISKEGIALFASVFSLAFKNCKWK